MRLALDEAGWTDVAAVLRGFDAENIPLSRAELDELVMTSDKQRFSLSDDGLRIRANQGHSVQVELGYAATTPPDLLFHGTVARFLSAIRKEGLLRRGRHHVHLSETAETARIVGQRRGPPVILTVRAREMSRAGHLFFVSANQVWLTDSVPAQYIGFPRIG